MKVLIIQQKMIGDVLTTSILFEAIKQQYPDSELHYVINSHTYPVVEHNPYIDKFLFFTPEIEKSKRLFFRFLKSIKAHKYDVVIDVYSKLSSNLISYYSNSKIKISKHKWYTNFMYTHTYKDQSTSNTIGGLAIENRLRLLLPLPVKSATVIKPKIYLTTTEKAEAKQLLEFNGITINKPLFMISVLGSNISKTYPFRYMAKVIDQIVLEQPDCQILFNYIPNQKADANAILELCSKATRQHIFFSVFGKNLRAFLAITSYCDAVIGNEGGAINMAKALNVPTFAIFSPWIIKEAWNMFDDGKKHVSVHLKDYNNTPYLNIKHPKVLKNKASELYEGFKPSLFKIDLANFLKPFN